LIRINTAAYIPIAILAVIGQDWKMPTPISKTYFPTIFFAFLHPSLLTDVNASHKAVADIIISTELHPF
jgi:hypothetical protein